MRTFFWTKKRSTLTIILITILTTSAAFGLLQMNKGAQAAILSPNPPSGCVGLWNFNEGTGTVTADSSGNGNTGTISGATWVAGKYGQALNFNGVNNYVDVGTGASLYPSSAISVLAWINIHDINPSDYPRIVSCLKNDGTWKGYEIFQNIHSNSINIQINVGGTFYSFYIGAVTQDQWANVGFTFDGTSITTYFNGVASSPHSISGTIVYTATAQSLRIGQNPNIGIAPNGIIDEVSVYNRALSTTEIQNNLQNNPGFTSQLTAKIPKGTTQVITTLTYQGSGSINATITSPSQTYTEDAIPVYQKTSYSTTGSQTDMLNIKRLSISVAALPVDQTWTIALTFDSITAYQISVEVQK